MSAQPYQLESEEIRRRVEQPGKLLRQGASIAGTVAGVAGIGPAANLVKKVLPFLSEFVPENLVQKGLSKINPRLGKFVKDTQGAGFGIDEIKGFIKDKIQPAKQSGNVIEQYSPELFQFISEGVKKGLSPYKVASKAYEDKNFRGIIDKLTQDHKSSFAEILDSIFGSEGTQENTRQEALGKFNQKKTGLMDEERQRFQQAYPQAQQQGQGGSQGDQAIIAALQKILSM